MTTIHRHTARTGFTLAELLVATMLLSIVMTSVYVLFNSSLRAWRTVESGFNAHLEARAFMTIFSHEYGNLAARAPHLFEGKNDSITMFVIAQPENLEEGEGRRMMRVEYSYNRGKHEVVREEAFVDGALPAIPAGQDSVDHKRIKVGNKQRTTVVKNATDFQIRYIWVPFPNNPVNPKFPPEPPEQIIMERNEKKWGFPQAVEIMLEVTNPSDTKDTYAVTSTFPLRIPTARRTLADLDRTLGRAK